MSYTPKIVGQLKLQFAEDMRTQNCPERCPRCESLKYKRNGYTKKGSIRYRCVSCGKSFISRSDMANDTSRKSIETWDLFVDCMLSYCSHRYAARICNISPTTSMAWRYLLFDSLEKLYSQHQIDTENQIMPNISSEEMDDLDDLHLGLDQVLQTDAEIGDQMMIPDGPDPINDSSLRVDVGRWNKIYIRNVRKYRLWQNFVKRAMESGYEKRFIVSRILKK